MLAWGSRFILSAPNNLRFGAIVSSLIPLWGYLRGPKISGFRVYLILSGFYGNPVKEPLQGLHETYRGPLKAMEGY